MTKTSCLSESKYLLERELRTRGYGVVVSNRDFHVTHGSGHFSIGFLPGNRRVLVSHYSYINHDARNKGFGKRLLIVREEVAKAAGVNLLLATVKNENAVEVHLLKSNGWKRFTNRRDTKTSLWGKQL